MRGHPGGAYGRGVLAPRDAYRTWASTYEQETAVSALEDRIVREISPSTQGRRILDAGCGTGRRVRSCEGLPKLALGLDLVPEMLLAGWPGGTPFLRVAADLRRMPVRDATFDLVWCRLVIGHVPDFEVAYGELARVTRAGGDLFLSDFHPAAVAAGHRRTFRDAGGRVLGVEHHTRSIAEHLGAAGAVGWVHVATVEAAAGGPEKPYYERAGRLEQFVRERDLPLVAVMHFRL